ncbi:NAD(P)H-dependent glycerol-3-phosphate dehydrogenase [Helicovermis profundi]|uniref:Glycerol-3-phosphate dehydrogenase [NAD(P)+] n=1 Tax=Helicovermis profundi TaxID=3065157 RepID=A0AAU9E7T4_9FIRM|nr:NAD(P)H-dependent glycerol-3-phosphate dehydrogenase [Clostridia bacterium S502]
MKIAILGAGSWGTALAYVLINNEFKVNLWTRNSIDLNYMRENKVNKKYLPDVLLDKNIEFINNIEDSIKDVDVIVLAVSSQATRNILETIKEHVNKNQLIVNVSKGIELVSLKTISQIVKEFFPNNNFVALSGPSHAEEVSKGMPTTLVSASIDKRSAELIQDIFTTEYLRVYTNPDVIGVEIGGSLKNIIALGAGISDGLGYGDNAKAALMTRGIYEIAKLGKIMGAKTTTFTGLSGIGDLIVTCTSMHSRNRRCGILIGEGKKPKDALEKIGMVVEGFYTVESAYYLSKKYNVEMPITRELYKVIYENHGARDSVKSLMMRSKKHEIEEMILNPIEWN